MTGERHVSRRTWLATALAAGPGVIAGTALAEADSGAERRPPMADADPRIRGPFPILSTPFRENGEVDFDVLARQARFVEWGGCAGVIWPQSNDSIDLLTTVEKLEGMEALADATRGGKAALCLGVQGKDTKEMLVFARHAEALAPAAIISRPPDSAKTAEDLRHYWRALAAVATRPVILQTTGSAGYGGPVPAPQMMIELAREFSHFGYVKEEAGDVLGRMRESLAARPPVRRVFSARGGLHWLEESRLGSEGVITERAAYADLLTLIWNLQQGGDKPEVLQDAFGAFIRMVSVKPGGLRDANLYVLQKRGVFKNLISRQYGPGWSRPASPVVTELALSPEKIEEIEMRFDALRPFLKEVAPDSIGPT